MMRIVPFLIAAATIACTADSGQGPIEVVPVAGGTYSLGSGASERESAYRDSPPAVRDAGWYDAWEADPYEVELASFTIDRTPVTHAEYAEFVRSTGHRPPGIDSVTYQNQRFLAHEWSEVRAFRWIDARPPAGLGDHPVVLVDHEDAAAYCAWRGEREGTLVRLPAGPEWEAACRGPERRTYAWGDQWHDGAIVSDTTFTAAVGTHPGGATPGGVQDLLGNVFEWTSSTMPPPRSGEPVLRGCSWDDSPGTCRCAFRHGRPAESRHILIGFRCAAPLRR